MINLYLYLILYPYQIIDQYLVLRTKHLYFSVKDLI